jgi:mannosylglycerate hydrolase
MLRSIGMLSRNRHALRDEPAGPQLPTPEAQCRGLRTVELAILPYQGAWHAAGVLAEAEAYRHDLLAFPGAADVAAALPAPTSGLSVGGAGVALTSVRDRAGRTEVRLVAQTPSDTTAVLGSAAIRAAWRADLLGRAGEALAVDADGLVRLRMRAWEIATVQLDVSV